MSADTETNLYELVQDMARGRLDGTVRPELPTKEELELATDALDAVQEFLTSPLAQSVIAYSAAACRSGGFEESDEEIGRLLRWAEHVRSATDLIVNHAAQVAVLAHDDFQNDFLGDGCPGSPVLDPERYLELRRRHGWGDPS